MTGLGYLSQKPQYVRSNCEERNGIQWQLGRKQDPRRLPATKRYVSEHQRSSDRTQHHAERLFLLAPTGCTWPRATSGGKTSAVCNRCEAVIRSHNPNITPRSIATFGLSHVAASFHPNAWHQPQAPARHVSEFSGHTVEGPANFHAWSALGFVAH